AHETIRIEAERDAPDQLEFPRDNPTVAQFGLFPALAALETIVYPPSAQLLAHDIQAQLGTIEIAPVEGPLSLFVWSRSRIVPVRLTEFTVTEEAFDTSLNPIRARVSLGMRVLTVDDLGFAHRGGNLVLLYQQQKERVAARSVNSVRKVRGIPGLRGV